MTRRPRTPEHFPRMKHRAAGRLLGLRGHPLPRFRAAFAQLQAFAHDVSDAFDELIAANITEVRTLATLTELTTTRRRTRINGCTTCTADFLYAPHHDPAPDCQADSEDHCTCTTCH